ncbi:hypothetical protein diail_11633 [Diaporthe ilicicola]|nr:hypothetical protein diail_11633 [Diaporthe ilicicola]
MTTPRSDSELEQLYRRVIADPQSATRAEYNIVWQWPPPEEEDRLCVEKTGLTRAGLVAKALAAPGELTRDEALIIHDAQGVNFAARPSIAEVLRRRKERTPLDALRDEAGASLRRAAGAGEKAALMNAVERTIALGRAEAETTQRGWDEREAAERLRAGTPWVGAMLRNGLLDGGASWGFVVFRTGSYGGGPAADEAWRRFRGYFDSAAEAMILHFNSGPLLWPKFRAVFVERKELEGASDEELRDEFRRMRRGAGGAGAQELPKGMRTSCFLVADRSAIECEAVTTGFIVRHDNGQAPSVNIRPDDPVAYVRAVDPDFRERRGQGIQGPAPDRGGEVIGTQGAAAGKEDAMADFPGAVKVALPRVFDWLHFVCFHAERGAAWEGRPCAHGWPEIYQQTKEPEVWVRDWAANSGSIHYTTHSYLTSQRMQS